MSTGSELRRPVLCLVVDYEPTEVCLCFINFVKLQFQGVLLTTVLFSSASISGVEFVKEPACWWTCDQQRDDGNDALHVECHLRGSEK